MRISTAFPSKYLKAADLDGRQVTVEIANVQMEEVGTGEEPKPVIYFQGKAKGVVLNKTNSSVLVAAYGDDTDDWGGQNVTLFSSHVDFQGRSVEAIRMKVPPRKAAPKPKTDAQALAASLDDDVPF